MHLDSSKYSNIQSIWMSFTVVFIDQIYRIQDCEENEMDVDFLEDASYVREDCEGILEKSFKNHY